MSASIAEAIRQLMHNKGISQELLYQTVEDVLITAYKKKFGTSENAVTKIDEENDEVYLYAQKEVVDEVENSVTEMSLEEAREMNSECELNDEILVEIKPDELGRIAAQAAKQIVFQRLKEIEKNVIFSEYSQKKGQLLTGHFQRERNGHIYIDLGRTEAILPKSEQSPKEIFTTGERIKAVIIDVKNHKKGTQIVMSRACPEFVQRLFELDVPEIAEGEIQIKSIVRDAGYRTKLAVYAKDIDPVGACVGMKGMRIQTIVKELEGEKIDIIRYNDNVREYLSNALSPSKVQQIVIVNEDERQALAVVNEDQLSLAIGKQGQNVKLAAKLTGWNIDIKTPEEFEQMDLVTESSKMAESIFGDVEEEEGNSIRLLTDLNENIFDILEDANIFYIEELLEKMKELNEIEELNEEMIEAINKSIKENVEVVDDEGGTEETAEEEPVNEIDTEESAEVSETVEESVDQEETEESDQVEEESDEDSEEVEYFCPECDTQLKEGQTICPGCGIELEFE